MYGLKSPKCGKYIYVSYILTLLVPLAFSAQWELKKKPPNQPQICNSEMCECSVIGFECQIKEKFGLVTVEGITKASDDGRYAATSALKITCIYNPMDLDILLSKMPPMILYHTICFHLIKCLQMPALLRQPNVTYHGTVEFYEYFDAPEGFFQNAHRLEKLTLPVKFQFVHEPLPKLLLHNLTNLKSLTIVGYTRHPTLSWPIELFHTLYNLETLTLDVVALQVSLRNLSSAHFRDLRALKQLNLDNNFMMTLREDLFSTLNELNRLSLRLNGLEELPEDLLRSQRKLVRLDLSNNRLQSIPRRLFEHTPLLWELLLTRNQLSAPSHIIENIRALNYLHRLDLGSNNFKSIMGTGEYRNETLLTRQRKVDAHELEHLSSMIFDSSDESKQRNSFENALNYTLINLSGNKLEYFSFDWIAGAGIKCPYLVDLTDNTIRNLYAIVKPTNLICLHEVHLKRNPLACDCKLAWVYSTNLLVHADNWTCATPSRLSGRGLQNLERKELCSFAPAWCPDRCVCRQQTATVLLINCTRARLQALSQLPRPEQLALAESILLLDYNTFYELPSNATFGYTNVTSLYASHNRLNILLPSQLPPRLNVLDVRDNQLKRLDNGFLLSYLNQSTTLRELLLANNPWLCDCEAEQLLYTLRFNRMRIPDFENLVCANFPNFTLADVNFSDICVLPPRTLSTIMAYLIITFFIILVALSFIALYYKYELEVKVWLHSHNVNLICFSIYELEDMDKTFDAFISYSHRDQNYVNQILLPGLERGPPSFRICTHERNWLAGAYIPEQIVESVAQSRRTIIVLSQHFIESNWGRMEFKTAHQSAINERRARIIIIKYGEISDMSNLDEQLQVYLRMNTYLEAEDPRFWQKLRYAMPHKRGLARKAGLLEVGGKTYVCGQVEINKLTKGDHTNNKI